MSEIAEFVKKTLAFGLGLAALTSDKVRQFVDEAVQKGEMTREEAKKFMEDVSARAEEQRKDLQSWMRDQINKMLAAGGAASAERVTHLEARVAALERRLEDLSARIGGTEPGEQPSSPTGETT